MTDREGQGAALEMSPRTDGGFTVRDPAFAARIRESFAAQAFMATIGARLEAVEPGRVSIALASRADLTQQHGYLHGGVVMSVADVAAGYAAMSLMGPGDGVLTADIKLNLLRPARGEGILAVAGVVRPGRTLSVVRADVLSGTDGDGPLLATALFGMMRMEGLG